MNLFILMGTHLAEIRQCVEFLARSEETSGPVELHVPDGLAWSDPEGYPCTLKTYDPESMIWVFNPDADGTVFLLMDPRLDPVAQLENLAEDLKKCLVEPLKIITCVDCEVAEKHSKVKAYYDACIYYSDIVLMGNRATIAKAFTREFEKHYQRNCYPCLFLMLKGSGYPAEPLEILTPGIRRLSQLFDLEDESPVEEIPGLIIEASCDLDMDEEEADPFRHPTPERETIHLPDVTEFIVPARSPKVDEKP